MDTPRKYVPIERKILEEKYLSKNIPDLFVSDHGIVFYFLNEKPDKTHKKRKFIPNHEGKLKAVCHPHKNAFNVDKYLFWMTCFIMEKNIFFKFGLVSYLDIRVLKKNGNMELQYNIIFNSTSI